MLQSGKNFNSHHRAGSHWTTGLKIQSILLILLTLFGIFQLAASPSQAQAAGTANLLQKTITWGDGTVETVVIDSNGNFILNGAQTKLVGFCDSMIYAQGVPYDADNMAILNKELDYLQSKGVRLYQVNLWLWGEDAYDGLLQMFYNHKMLVVPLFSGTGEAYFGDLTTTDFTVDSTGTISTFFAAWLKHVKSFQNVVSIIIENELDIQMSGSGYTLSNVTKYMDMLYNYAKANTTLPILTKFGVLNYDANAASVQNAFLHYSAIPAFDLYYTDATSFGSGCATTSNWYSTKTSVSQMWVTEANYAYAREPGYYNATKFTKEMVDAMFSHNVSAVFLFAVQDKYDSTAMFFDTLGNPIANTEVLMANMAAWQAPVTPAPVVVEVPTLSSPSNAATVSNVTPTLSWNPSAGASTYSLQVSANTTFSPTLVNQNALTGSSYSIPAGVLSQGVTYNWRVAAKDANSNTSAWSSVFTFKTPAAAASTGYALASFTVTNGGSGYTSVPTVTISGGNGSGATAIAIVGNKVGSITVTNGGKGYFSAPAVVISGGGGSGAKAVANIKSIGPRVTVASVTVTDGGQGYTSAPTISFLGGGGSGAAATATLSTGSVISLKLTNAGSGYTSSPTVTISGGGGSGATATAALATGSAPAPVPTGSVASITVTNGGKGYYSAPAVNITGGGGSGATAVANIKSIGGKVMVASVTITNPGQGYTSAPTITFLGGGGAGATAVATLTK